MFVIPVGESCFDRPSLNKILDPLCCATELDSGPSDFDGGMPKSGVIGVLS